VEPNGAALLAGGAGGDTQNSVTLTCPRMFGEAHRFLWNLMGQLTAQEAKPGEQEQACDFTSAPCPAGRVGAGLQRVSGGPRSAHRHATGARTV